MTFSRITQKLLLSPSIGCINPWTSVVINTLLPQASGPISIPDVSTARYGSAVDFSREGGGADNRTDAYVGAPFIDIITGGTSNQGGTYPYSWSEGTAAGIGTWNWGGGFWNGAGLGALTQDANLGTRVSVQSDGQYFIASAPGALITAGLGNTNYREWNIADNQNLTPVPTSGADQSGLNGFTTTRDGSWHVEADDASPYIVRVWRRTAGTWAFHSELPNAGVNTNARAGASITISDDAQTIVIGAPDRDTGGPETKSGIIVTYELAIDELSYSFSAYTTDGVNVTDTRFGESVSMTGDGSLLAVGSLAPVTDGSVRLFTRDGAGWAQQEELLNTESDALGNEDFGTVLRFSRDNKYLIISAPGWSYDGVNDCGKVYVYGIIGGVWQELQKLEPIVKTNQMDFGRAIAGDATMVMVGAPNDQIAAVNAGSIHYYQAIGCLPFSDYAKAALSMGVSTYYEVGGNIGSINSGDSDDATATFNDGTSEKITGITLQCPTDSGFETVSDATKSTFKGSYEFATDDRTYSAVFKLTDTNPMTLYGSGFYAPEGGNQPRGWLVVANQNYIDTLTGSSSATEGGIRGFKVWRQYLRTSIPLDTPVLLTMVLNGGTGSVIDQACYINGERAQSAVEFNVTVDLSGGDRSDGFYLKDHDEAIDVSNLYTIDDDFRIGYTEGTNTDSFPGTITDGLQTGCIGGVSFYEGGNINGPFNAKLLTALGLTALPKAPAPVPPEMALNADNSWPSTENMRFSTSGSMSVRWESGRTYITWTNNGNWQATESITVLPNTEYSFKWKGGVRDIAVVTQGVRFGTVSLDSSNGTSTNWADGTDREHIFTTAGGQTEFVTTFQMDSTSLGAETFLEYISLQET